MNLRLGYSSVVKCLPSVWESLGSLPSSGKKIRRNSLIDIGVFRVQAFYEQTLVGYFSSDFLYAIWWFYFFWIYFLKYEFLGLGWSSVVVSGMLGRLKGWIHTHTHTYMCTPAHAYTCKSNIQKHVCYEVLVSCLYSQIALICYLLHCKFFFFFPKVKNNRQHLFSCVICIR